MKTPKIYIYKWDVRKGVFMFYIQEIDKLTKIEEIFNRFIVEGNKIKIPIQKDLKNNKIENLAKKTNKILKKKEENRIILSNEIRKNEAYVSFLNSYNLEIIDGKFLDDYLICDMVDYIMKKKELKSEETEISILCNQITDLIVLDIENFAKKMKRVNIVTNHIDKFKKISEKIYDDYGIIITISNNRKKSLVKSKIIINYDFVSEIINKFNLYEEAIIINVKEKTKINKKRFNGVNIIDYTINVGKDEDFDYDLENKFDKKAIYESTIYKKDSYKKIIDKIKKDGVEIKNLIGMHGVI